MNWFYFGLLLFQHVVVVVAADAGDVAVRVAVDADGIVAKHFAAVAINVVGLLRKLRWLMMMLRMRMTTGSTTYQAHCEVAVVLKVFCG